MKSERRTPSTGPPDFLTIEEAAAVIRIGRTVAYQLARRYLSTDGREGLPVVRFGRQLRVPRARLEDFIGGPVTWPPPSLEKSPSTSTPTAMPAIPRERRSANGRQSTFQLFE
jgi:excisionase family DNA binding protein